MLARLALRTAALGLRPAATPAFAVRGMSSGFNDRELAMERQYFNKEDEKALRQILAKMREHHEEPESAPAHEDELHEILGHDVDEETKAKLLKWKQMPH